MDLKVIARVRAIDEDMLLQGIEPKDVTTFVWAKKYIKPYDVSYYWELEKGKKTVIVYDDGELDIIRENIDKFAVRLENQRAKSVEEQEEEVEFETELNGEEEEEQEGEEGEDGV